MTEVNKPSLLEQRRDAVKRWINEEEVMFAGKIKKEVKLLLSPHKYALPPQIALKRPKEPTELEGRFFGKYLEYDTESGDLSEVIEEYFDSESNPPIVRSRQQLPITVLIGCRDEVIDASMWHLKQKQSIQS